MKLFDVYPLFDIEIVRGDGCFVFDSKGNRYLDLYGGHAVISVGHSHPRYVKALESQAEKLVFYSNSVHNPLQQQLADKLGRISGYDDYQLFLVNSGAEANENAMKLASFHTGRSRIIAFSKAFHGRTSLAVEATDNPKIIAPVNANRRVTFVPFGDAEAAETEMEKGDVAAVIVEGIQGVGGINIPCAGFWNKLREACTRHGVVLIADEIQSGYGRTGKFFAHQHSGIKADIVTVAKGIANGFPMSGVIISPDIRPAYGMLGTTFGGNHLACTAALAVLDVIENEHLVENAAKVGEFFRNAFHPDGKLDHALSEYRGKGLMIGLEIRPEYAGLRDRLLFEEHYFTGAAGASVIRLLPSLTISIETASRFMDSWHSLTAK